MKRLGHTEHYSVIVNGYFTDVGAYQGPSKEQWQK